MICKNNIWNGCAHTVNNVGRSVNYLKMFSERAPMRIRFIAELADIPFVRCMDTHVFLFITAVCKAPLTGLESASERFFTCNKIQTLDKNTLSQRYIQEMY